jgi:MerR family redox-sensitive transcriptional activator SoxR
VFAERVGLTLGKIGTELAKLPEGRMPARRNWERPSRRWSTRTDERERIKAARARRARR